MARTTKKSESLNLQMKEVGYNGLRISGRQVYEELKKELQFPTSIITYKQMGYDSTIASALSYYEHMMMKAKFTFIPHHSATEEEKEYAKFMQQCIDDMEHSWQDFVQEVSSMNTYGFCVNEIVLRQRLRKSGSKFNDGKIGIRKLPVRAQDTISGWNYNDKQELESLTQSVTSVSKDGSILLTNKGEEIKINREKFLLFRLGKKKDSPVGESPLRACYYPWKFKNNVEEMESVGLNRDLSGIPVMYIPPELMDDDADPKKRAEYEVCQNIVRNIGAGQQSGLVLPQVFDEKGNKLIDLTLLKNEGGKAYDTSKIKDYYCKAILTALSADILLMGQSSTGSYALGNIKTTLSAIAIETKLKEICNVINQHLIPLIGELNDWNLERLPSLIIDDLESVSLEDVSKYVQRIASTGFMPKTPDVVNKILNVFGLEDLPEGTDLDEVLSDNTSRAGDGMNTAGDGTSTDPTNVSSNDNNLDNAS